MSDLSRAKQIFAAENCTCTLVKGETVYKSEARGVFPLIKWLDCGTDLSGFSAADKIVGRAAALLYIYMDISALYAEVISESALSFLLSRGVAVEYLTLTRQIVNRAGDGICPMELLTKDISDPSAAFAALRNALAKLL